MVHEHWDGCARPRNVDYGTRQLGDHEPYSSHGSGSPGGVYRGRRGRLEVTLQSWMSRDYYGGERVNTFWHLGSYTTVVTIAVTTVITTVVTTVVRA